MGIIEVNQTGFFSSFLVEHLSRFFCSFRENFVVFTIFLMFSSLLALKCVCSIKVLTSVVDSTFHAGSLNQRQRGILSVTPRKVSVF
jgi:hypothetical protein